MFSVEKRNNDARPPIRQLGVLKLKTAVTAGLIAAISASALASTASAVNPIQTLGEAAYAEKSLRGQIAAINGRVSRLGGQIGKLRNDEAVTQAKLNREIARLQAERARYQRLKVKLKRKVRLLIQRARVIFEQNDPDVLSVALKSKGFEELLTRIDFARRIAHGDRKLVDTVKSLKQRSLKKKQTIKQLAIQIEAHRNQLAASRAGLENESAKLVNVRAASESKLASVQQQRAAIQAQIARYQAAQRAQAASVSQTGAPIYNPSDAISSGPGNITAPSGSPEALQKAIEAANEIAKTPYKWGGGHGSLNDSGYDCSGSLSYALMKAGLQKAPLTSGSYTSWGSPGGGDDNDIKVYANSGHAYAKLGKKYFDTSAQKQTGSRWSSKNLNGTSGYTVRHVSIN